MADNVPGPEGAPPSSSPAGAAPEVPKAPPLSQEDKLNQPTKTVTLSSLAKPPPLPQPVSGDLKPPSVPAPPPLRPPVTPPVQPPAAGPLPRSGGTTEVKLPPKTTALPRLTNTGTLPRLTSALPTTPITMPPVAKGNASESPTLDDKKAPAPAAAPKMPPPLPVLKPVEAKALPKPAEPKASTIKLNTTTSLKPNVPNESLFPPEAEEKAEPERPPEGWKHLEPGELNPLDSNLQSLEAFTKSQHPAQVDKPKPVAETKPAAAATPLTTLPPVTPPTPPAPLQPPVLLSSPAPATTARAPVKPPPLPPPTKPTEKATAPQPNTAPPLLEKGPSVPTEKLPAPNLPKIEAPAAPVAPALVNSPVALKTSAPIKPDATPIGKAPPVIPAKPPTVPTVPPPIAPKAADPAPVAKKERSIPLFLFPAKSKAKPTGQTPPVADAKGKNASPGAASPTIKVEETKPALKPPVLPDRTLANPKAAPATPPTITPVPPPVTTPPAQSPSTAAKATPPEVPAATTKAPELVKPSTLPSKAVTEPAAAPAIPPATTPTQPPATTSPAQSPSTAAKATPPEVPAATTKAPESVKPPTLPVKTVTEPPATPPATTPAQPSATTPPAQSPSTAAKVTPPEVPAAATKTPEPVKLPTLPVKTVTEPPAAPAPVAATSKPVEEIKLPTLPVKTVEKKSEEKPLETVGASKTQEVTKSGHLSTHTGTVPPDKTGAPVALPPPTSTPTPAPALAPLPMTRAARMRKKRFVETVAFYSVLVIIIGPVLYVSTLHFGRNTEVEGQVIPPQGMLLGNEILIVGDFREQVGNETDDLAKERAPKLHDIQEHQDHVQRAQADIAAREERIRLLKEQIQAAKDEIASVVKQAHDASQQIWDGPGAQLEDEYNARLEQLQKTIADRAKALNLKYQPDDSYRSPEVWANAYRLALYDVPAGVDSAKEHQWVEDQLKQWRDFTKSLDDRQKQLREQAAQIRLSPTQKVTELNTKIEELQQRIEGTLAEEDPIKSELQQAQTDLTQVQTAEAGLDDKYYKQLYSLPEGSVTDRISIAPNGRFNWPHIEKNKPFAEGENFHHYYLFARATRTDGRQYWALLHLSVEKDGVLPVVIEPTDFISTKTLLRPDLSPDEQQQ